MTVRRLIPVLLVLVGCLQAEPLPRNRASQIISWNRSSHARTIRSENRVDLSTLVKRGDQYLVPGSLNPYTGPFVSYHSPTIVNEWGGMRNGYLHGPFEGYHENGQLRTKRSYSNGEWTGPFERYYENGQLDTKGSFSNGSNDGPWESYYENGELAFKGSFSNGTRCGEWINLAGETVTYDPCPSN